MWIVFAIGNDDTKIQVVSHQKRFLWLLDARQQ